MFLKEEKESEHFRASIKKIQDYQYDLQKLDSGCVLGFTNNNHICLYVSSGLH